MKQATSREFERVSPIFAFRIRELRRELGLSQEELADEAGCHRTYIGMLERRQGNPSLRILCLICDALGVELNELLVIENNDDEEESMQ